MRPVAKLGLHQNHLHRGPAEAGPPDPHHRQNRGVVKQSALTEVEGGEERFCLGPEDSELHCYGRAAPPVVGDKGSRLLISHLEPQHGQIRQKYLSEPRRRYLDCMAKCADTYSR